jgi:hypothetical protein
MVKCKNLSYQLVNLANYLQEEVGQRYIGNLAIVED